MNLIETKNPVSMDKKLVSMEKRYKTRDGRDVRVLCVWMPAKVTTLLLL